MNNIIAVAQQTESAPVSVSRPQWDDVYENYPKVNAGTSYEDDEPGQNIFTRLFGEDYDRSIFQNACATRVSLALIGSGMKVKAEYIIQKGDMRGKGIIVSAVNLLKWLSQASVFGNADIIIKSPESLKDVQDKIGDKKGIYIMEAKNYQWATGHATLWYNKNAIGSHDYWEYAKEIHFWELK